MFELPPLLLGKWATIGSLSQNLFCWLQVKGEWLTILESLKKKTNKANSHNHQPNKKRHFYELKRIHICGVHLRLLPQTSLGGTYLPSLLILVRLLPHGGLGLYLYLYLFYRACILNVSRICARILTFIGSMLAYSIPSGYVHKFCVLPFWFVWFVAYAFIFNSNRIYAQFQYCIGFVLAYSIPSRYVQKFCILTCLTIFWMKDPLGMRRTH